MTTERLVTEYTADTRNFRRGAKVYDQTLARQQRITNDRLSRIDRRWDRSTRSILNTRTALVGLTGYVGGAALGELRRYAEGWRDVERRLQSIGVVSAEGQKNLVQLALRTRSSVQGTATIVQRFQRSTGDGIEVTTRRVETLQKLLAVQGATGSERNALGVQLGQALQSGVLSGDEFRTIRENSPVEFLDALAKAAGVTRRELKATAEAQKLTTEVVLEALDGMADAADTKFGALAMSGDEAFNVLQTGLTVYVGNVDKALGATETINGAVSWLGEYLSDAGDGAQTLAAAIQIVGAMALAVAGSRGFGALNAAVQRSALTAQFAVQEAQKEVVASRQKITAAQQEMAASRALVVQRQAELVARMQANKKLTGANKSLEAAKRKNARATTALAGAEARATVATDRLTASQRRLTFAARASEGALRAARSVLAFFGGPLGLAITALSALPFLLTDVDDRMAALDTTSQQAMEAMDRYAAASKRAAEEQDFLGGKISDATQAMLNQSRVEMQDTLRELQEAQTELLNDVRGVGLFDNSEITAPLALLENELQRLYTQYGTDNVFLSGAIQGLKDLQAGTADLQQLSAVLNDVRSVGEEAFAAYGAYTSAVADNTDLESGRQALLDYATAAGIFQENIDAVAAAETPVQLQAAYQNLADIVFDAASAARLFGDDSVRAVTDMAKKGALAELQMQYLEAALAGNSEEAARLRSEIEGATGAATDLAATPPPDYSGSANSAAALAEQLGISLNLAQRLSNALPRGAGSNIIFDPRHPNYDPEAARLGRIAANMADLNKSASRVSPFDPSRLPSVSTRGPAPRSGGGGGGRSTGSAVNDARDAERDLAAARELLAENGHRALYIEKELNTERERLRELLPSLIDLGLSRADAEGVINSELARTEERLRNVKTASEEAAEAFAKGVLSDIRSAENLGDALGRISDKLWDLTLDPVFDVLAKQFASLATGGGGAGILANVASFLFNAKGNAFDASGVVPFARGGVVDRPTFFGFGGGRNGVMGEAGPEAILPLSRGRDGKLGVMAEMPTTPTLPAGGVQANSTFSWTGDMVIQSNSDQPQEVGRDVADRMQIMFHQMFSKQLGNAMRGGGVLNAAYQKKAGA